jgi:plasmid stabilization system protein ParE
MAEFRLSTAAQADFNQIIDYLADVAGNRVAADYAGRLRESVNRVAQLPGIGAPRPHFGPETRITIVKPYVIFYDGGPHSERVHVLRILHGHRNITPELIAHGRAP